VPPHPAVGSRKGTKFLTKIDTGAKKTAKYRLPSGEMTDFLFAEGKCK